MHMLPSMLNQLYLRGGGAFEGTASSCALVINIEYAGAVANSPIISGIGVQCHLKKKILCINPGLACL